MPRKQANPKFPALVLVDTREQLPYALNEIPADIELGGGLWGVETAQVKLPSGDYSLDGYAACIAVERKSKEDLFGTVGQRRDKFIRALERLNEMNFAAVVVEAEWSEIFETPPYYSSLTPRTIYRSILAWQQRYPRVHWWFVPDREVGEMTTFRILERFLKEQGEIPFRKVKAK